MCGIAGVIGRDATEPIIQTMIGSLRHRGPDGEGILPVPSGYFAHRRLSIIDLSDAGRQPMVSADGRYTLIFNGEIYNYKELREELSDYAFQSQSDSEVLLAAWDKWGEAALERFLGMFAFALSDRKTGEVVIVRDRLGIKPLFYHVTNDTLYFGSEIKAILSAGAKAEPNERILSHYLLRGYYDHTPETFFEGIVSLPAAHILRWSDGNLSLKRWWSLPERVGSIASLSDGECLDAFRALFDDSLRLHLRSDVPVGINLSSGIDSLSLLYELKRVVDPRSLTIFSMGFADPAFDETIDVARIAKEQQIPYFRTEIVPQDHFAYLQETVNALDQPFGGLSTIAYLKLMHLTKEHKTTVLLEGQGVDEQFGGYQYYFGPLYVDYLHHHDWGRIRAEIRRLARKPGFRVWLSGLRTFWETAQKTKRPVFQDGSAFLRQDCLRPEWVERMQKIPAPVFETPFASSLLNALYRDTTATKLPRVLRFNDHLSMAVGRELRVPFLDHRLTELAFSLPHRLKIDGGMTKVILREAMRGLVPEELRTRKKRSQSSPQAHWYKTELREQILSEIRSDRFRALPMVNAEATERAFQSFVANPKDTNSFFFWQLINLAYWYESFR